VKNPRILDLLAQGIQIPQVLTIVGCHPTYLKSLLEDEEFKSELEAKQKEYFAEADEEVIISNRYLSLEHKLLKQIDSMIPNAEMRDVLKALDVVANRQEKAKGRLASPTERGNTTVYQQINLTLPKHTIPEYTLNGNKEVVAIGNIGMSPMTGSKVKELFDGMKSGEKLVSL